MLQVITAMFRVEAVCDHRFRNMNSNRFRKIILVVLLLLPFGEVQGQCGHEYAGTIAWGPGRRGGCLVRAASIFTL